MRIRRDGSRSRSFQVFIEGVERAAATLAAPAPGEESN
jgi:hypothetical protein